MVPSPRFALVAIVAICAFALSGCSMLEQPTRDTDGTILTETVLPSAELLVGDCFTFLEGNNTYSTVTPCANEHAYVVISDGTLSQTEIDTAGTLQIAVAAACTEPFAAYVASVAAGTTKPDQQFIVSTADVDGASVTSYSCLATPVATVAAEG